MLLAIVIGLIIMLVALDIKERPRSETRRKLRGGAL